MTAMPNDDRFALFQQEAQKENEEGKEVVAMECPHHGDLSQDIRDIKKGIRAIEKGLTAGAVTMGKTAVRLGLVEKIVFGAVGLVLTCVFVAILALVINGGM